MKKKSSSGGHHFKSETGMIFRALRGNWTQGQAARRLGLTPAVIHNFEKLKSRIPLDIFTRFLELKGKNFADLVQKHSASLGQVDTSSLPLLIAGYRKRLKLTQSQCAKKLGYRSAAMVHHFEKGIRTPSLNDFLLLMSEAHDDCYSFVLEVTSDISLAAQFPAGNLAQTPESDEYWNHFYISAIRQILRTTRYRNHPIHQPELFEEMLSLTPAEVKYAFGVLSRLGIIEWQKDKFVPNPKFKLMKPKKNSEEKILNIKKQWLNYLSRSLTHPDPPNTNRVNKKQELLDSILTVDTLPMNPEIFQKMVFLIRTFQDELHRLPLKDTTGLGSVVILARLQELGTKSCPV